MYVLWGDIEVFVSVFGLGDRSVCKCVRGGGGLRCLYVCLGGRLKCLYVSVFW